MAVDLVGRREELEIFEGFLGAMPGGGQALLLEGDPGIGKTVLWEEAKRLARERGFRALTSRAAPSETQIAFATVGDAFAPVVEETLPDLPQVQRRALETALLLREPVVWKRENGIGNADTESMRAVQLAVARRLVASALTTSASCMN